MVQKMKHLFNFSMKMEHIYVIYQNFRKTDLATHRMDLLFVVE